ncbi:Acg family FMN-binding oxidoreductase [Streptomyces sp. NPDC048566]|uniref:Acg family FMN-binding oxidoreductase n=1 Tax=Streptomyces sp. NPDC048566 TaxID=3365569 RepID=UPI003723C788
MTTPATGTIDTNAVAALVADAGAAPSLHNAQPWAFRYLSGSGTLRLHADPSRHLPSVDPSRRNLLLGCGAALFNLRVAAAAAGLSPAVRLLPAPADPSLLAEIDLRGRAPSDPALAALHPAIARRHCSRHPFRDEEIPLPVRRKLVAAAEAEGAELLYVDAWHVQAILELVRDAEDREAHSARARGETLRWTRPEPDGAAPPPDGVPAAAFGPGQRLPTVPVRDFAAGRPVAGRGRVAFEEHPHIALLGTSRDRPEDWLRAGQALERVLLRATSDGLVASLTSQPLEWPEIRWMVRDPVSAMAHVQMVLRLGYGPAGHATPRRPVDDLLDVV